MRDGGFASVYNVAPPGHETNARHNEHWRVESKENIKGVRSMPIRVIGCST